MRIKLRCDDCEWLPGDSLVPETNMGAIKSAQRSMGSVAVRHVTLNDGHKARVFDDLGISSRVYTASGIKLVQCDECFDQVDKSECSFWENLIICRRCSGNDLCRCGHPKLTHVAMESECSVCRPICEEFILSEGH